MNAIANRYHWLDFVLRTVAEKIQLTRTAYERAQDRYQTIAEWVSDKSSPIAHLQPRIYPQGSFRVQSTISAHDDREEYDIDLVLELAIRRDADPDEVLTAVLQAIDRGRDTRYHGMVEKKRRCVTVNYADMHLDLTPAVLVPGLERRTVSIFDLHPHRPDHVIANPEGFALWFDEKILPRVLLEERLAKAMADPVPDQKPLDQKPLRLLVLQLLKRYRDVCHAAHRVPKIPSVLLSKLVAEVPQQTTSLFGDLSAVTDSLTATMRTGLRVANPACPFDVFTDRWPANATEQRRFLRDLTDLRAALDELRADGSQGAKQQLVAGLFGESVVRKAYTVLGEELAKQSGAGTLGILSGRGGLVLGAGTAPTLTAAVSTVPKHHFFGEE